MHIQFMFLDHMICSENAKSDRHEVITCRKRTVFKYRQTNHESGWTEKQKISDYAAMTSVLHRGNDLVRCLGLIYIFCFALGNIDK